MNRDALPGSAERRDLSISMEKANLYCFLILPLVILLAGIFVYLWGYDALSDGSTFERTFYAFVGVYALGFVVVALGVVAHEAIHGLSWAYFSGKPMSAIKFGF